MFTKALKKAVRHTKGCDIDFFNFYKSPNTAEIAFQLDGNPNGECDDQDNNRIIVDHVRFHPKEGTFTIYRQTEKGHKSKYKFHTKCDNGVRIPNTMYRTKVNCHRVPNYIFKFGSAQFVTIPYVKLLQQGCCVKLYYDKKVLEEAVRKLYPCHTLNGFWTDLDQNQYTKKEKLEGSITFVNFYYQRSRGNRSTCTKKMENIKF